MIFWALPHGFPFLALAHVSGILVARRIECGKTILLSLMNVSKENTMAKKKATSSAVAKTSTPKKQSISKSSSNGVASKTQGALGNEQIGITAGDIWSVLSQNGELTITALKKEIDAPSDLVLAGVGWLAREEKLQFTTSGRSAKVSLK
ncbi:hypothetical protein Pr1d_01180 [Bythopirellula goksoeyrii]|uniref:Winged helix-turn-helix domain-containing protein n=2 Tax=Bythopirellula goksoeyrii TaxID=1400387 RepID=A0A5B9Q1D7_9BACT|nr:hypothetical protein Pr1d_01180 [Bythopirellula goksoeyrii]